MSGSSDLDLALDRILEDLLDRQRRGHSIEIDRWIARYPEYAEELRGFLEDSEFLAPLLSEARTSVGHSPDDIGSGTSMPETGVSESSTPESPEVKGFRILEEIGSGSQGVVYKALQLGTQRVVALKVIREGLFASLRERLRFENEIRVAAHLTHPNVVAIYGSGCERGHHYFFMEYADGEPLGVHLSARTLTVPETVRLFLPICDAVGYAHQQGIIHRDLKPANVLVDRQGRPRVLDFGLAKRVNAGEELPITQVGSFAGTWYYASPEQVRRENGGADVRSDVYALGVMLYEAVTDAFPYPIGGASQDVIAHQIVHVEPIRPTLIRRDIGDELETIILQALQKDPARRYQSATALHEDLRRLLAGEPIEAKRDSRVYVLKKTLRLYRRWVVAATAALTLLVAFAATVTVLYSEARVARATSEARAEFDRLGLGFLLRDLDELHLLWNAVATVAQQEPNHPVVQRLGKPTLTVPVDEIASLLQSAPPNLDDVPLGRQGEEADQVRRWVVENAEAIAQLRGYTASHRFVFAEENAESSWIIAHRPSNWYPVQQLCGVLAVSATERALLGQVDDAEHDLDAARSLALDLADGPTFLHKNSALACRKASYGAFLAILEYGADDAEQVRRWDNWLHQDPPLPTLRGTITSEAMKVFQVFEGSIREARPSGGGHIDLELLDARTDGLFSELGVFPPPYLDALRSVTPVEALNALDRFGRELDARSEAGRSHLQVPSGRAAPIEDRGAAFRLLNPLLPSFDRGFQFRMQVTAWGAAARLASELCAFHLRNGAWPDSLDALGMLRSSVSEAELTGPYRVTYALTDGSPQVALEFDHEGAPTPGADPVERSTKTVFTRPRPVQ